MAHSMTRRPQRTRPLPNKRAFQNRPPNRIDSWLDKPRLSGTKLGLPARSPERSSRLRMFRIPRINSPYCSRALCTAPRDCRTVPRLYADLDCMDLIIFLVQAMSERIRDGMFLRTARARDDRPTPI